MQLQAILKVQCVWCWGSKMINLLKNISLLIVFGVVPTIALDYFSKSGFLDKFMADQSLTMIGTILAIYIAAASSFIAILNSYEDQEGKDIFSSTVRELKQTIAFIFIVFFAHFLLLVGTPKDASFVCDLALRSLKTFTFILFLYALYELSSELFALKNKLPRKDKK